MTNLIKHSGQVFTPDYLVANILDEAGYTGDDILQKHCIDNSCGDGAFICEIIRRYIIAFKKKYQTLDGIEKDLTTYIHGIELDPTAYACCLENIANLLSNFNLHNISIDLIQGDTLTIHSFDGKMDYVVGNPPYVRVHNLENNFNAVKSFHFANSGMTDLYLVFFEIGLNMIKPGGKLCYITPSSWINSIAGSALRKYILSHKNLISVIDLGHYQAFKATTYTMISLFQKGSSNTFFTYYTYNEHAREKYYICNIDFSKVSNNGNFYLADTQTLHELNQITSLASKKFVSVKNGFATLADKIFISDKFPFDEYTIPTIKASTGKWYKAFFPYDNNGNPIPKEKIFTHTAVSSYLLSHKDELLKGNNANNPMWYLYGRTQALKDVNSHKIAINTTIKGTDSIKLNNVPAGCGVYSGLYILSDIPYDIISDIIISDDFIKYIASLKKYKSGGYYTFSSKDLETYLNYKISQLISNEKLSLKPTNKQGFLDRHLSLF